jgi:hypothetical protein
VELLKISKLSLLFWSNWLEHYHFIKQEGKIDQTVQERAYLDPKKTTNGKTRKGETAVTTFR